jgi:GNAT superfamily N-acetyltransferase
MTAEPRAVEIVRATREHLEAIIAMLADDALGAGRESTAPDARGDYERAFEAIGRNPWTTLYVALHEGRVVGTFQLTLVPGLSLRGATRADIEAVRVEASMRGQGLGESMMRFAIAQAKASGAGIVQLASNKTRTDAHRFYERLGFARSHEGFKLKL